jgi:serine phosphatase RsbU (regulator of sigma subunit)
MSSLPVWQPSPPSSGVATTGFVPDERRHRVLLVDGEPLSRASLISMLAPSFTVEEVPDGETAIRRTLAGDIDIVLMDIRLPDAGGYEATRAIKRIAGDRLLPVLLMTANNDLEALARGLDAGADDFLITPVTRMVLEAKLNAALRAHEMFVEIRRQRDELERFRAAAQNDYAIAGRIFENILDRSCFGIPSIRKHVSPLEQFDGDLVMATAIHGGRLRFLLGDFTGHGLSAAVGAMPVADLFYATAARGLPLGAVVREINIKVERTLPREMFLAALIGDLDPRAGRLSFWNGGQPEGFVLDVEGNIRHRLRSTKIPLGIVSNEEFDDSIETIEVQRQERIFVYSDGVVESTSPNGELFGGERLERTLTASRGPAFASPAVETALSLHRDHAARRDDLTFLEIANDADLLPELERLRPDPPAFVSRREDTLRVRFDASTLAFDDPLKEIWDFLEARLKGGDREIAVVFNVVSELFLNALDHGILQLDSALKDEPDGLRRFFELRANRLAQLKEDTSVDVQVEVQERGLSRRILIRVESNGSGFSWRAAEASAPVATSTLRHGRGIALIRSYCRHLRWENEGRVAEAEMELPAGPAND